MTIQQISVDPFIHPLAQTTSLISHINFFSSFNGCEIDIVGMATSMG